MREKGELDVLIDELLYQRQALSSGHLRKHFSDLTMTEYIALKFICDSGSKNDLYDGKTYLKELSGAMNASMRKTSKTVRGLRDRGLLMWEHDGDGTDGTYVLITEAGEELVRRREAEVKDYFSRVIESFGREDTKHLIQMLKEFETVMSAELEEDEETDDES